MKSSLITRPVDANGRIVIPKNLIRDIFKAKDDEKLTLEIFYNEDSIILKRFHSKCVFCDNTENLIKYNDVDVCPECIKKIKNIKNI